MKKLIKIILTIFICLEMSGCSFDNNPIIDLINKEINIVRKVDEEIKHEYDFVYSDLKDCLEQNYTVIDDYTFNNSSAEDQFYWIVYIKDNKVIMHVNDYNMTFKEQNIILIDSNFCDYNDIDFLWRKYSNIINVVNIGKEHTTFNISFSLDDLFSSMSVLEEVHFINCCTDDISCTSMDNTFAYDENLKVVDFEDCSFESINTMNKTFLGCRNLLRCDLNDFGYDTITTHDSTFSDTNIYFKLETNNTSLKNAYNKCMDDLPSPGADNEILEIDNLYNDISEIDYLDATYINDVGYEFECQNYGSGLFWVVYQINDDIFLQISLTYFWIDDPDAKIIETGQCLFDKVNQGWKKYSNLIGNIHIAGEETFLCTCSMNGWFKDMDCLQSIWVEDVIFDDNTSLRSFCEGCKQLNEVTFWNVDLSEIYDISNMLNGCEQLDSFNFGDFSQDKQIKTEGLFLNCNPKAYFAGITNQYIYNEYVNSDIYEYNSKYANGIWSYYQKNFDEITYLEYVEKYWCTTADWPLDYDVYWIVFEYDDEFYLKIYPNAGMYDAWEGSKLIDYGYYYFSDVKQQWKTYGNLITRICLIGDPTLDYCCSMKGWFNNMKALEDVDIFSLSFGDEASMESMFAGCQNLRTVYITGCDFSNVYDISSCFKDCISLNDIIKLDYEGCTTIDFNNLGIDNTIDTFKNCTSLNENNIQIEALKQVFNYSYN